MPLVLTFQHQDQDLSVIERLRYAPALLLLHPSAGQSTQSPPYRCGLSVRRLNDLLQPRARGRHIQWCPPLGSSSTGLCLSSRSATLIMMSPTAIDHHALGVEWFSIFLPSISGLPCLPTRAENTCISHFVDPASILTPISIDLDI